MTQNNDATSTYGSAAAAAAASTGTYGSKLSETASYSDLREQQFKSGTHGIGVGDKISLRGRSYLITGIISVGTGEAVIYKAEDEQQNTLAIKLYFEFTNSKEEPSGETLKRIKEITDPDILKLHEFGVGMDKYQGRYCFEISDYAEGGDLFSVSDWKTKYSAQFIEKTIVREIFKGIKRLHGHRIYHCDLKPGNIFYLDHNQTDIIIGDYGSAKAYDLESEKDGRKTSTVKGTEVYLSPEQARGIISEKNDYYSFGMILLHLLYPESLTGESDFRQVRKEKLERIMERQYDSMPIIDYNPAHQRLNNLIEGLTLVNHTNRWGGNEVERWLKGENIEVRYKSFETGSIQPIKLGYATIVTSRDFINVLETTPEAYEDLIEDYDTYSTVKGWLDSYRDIPTRKVFDQMVRFYQPLGKKYVIQAMLRFFEPERPIAIDMHAFNFFTSTAIATEVEAFVAKLDEIWKITPLESLRLYLFQLEFSLRQVKELPNRQDPLVVTALVDKLYSVFGLVQKPFDNYITEIQTRLDPDNETEAFRQLLNLFYAFDHGRTFRDSNNHSLETLEELGLYFARNEQAFADKFVAAEKERFLEKIGRGALSQLNYLPFVFEVFKDKAEAEVELVELSFDRKRNYKVQYKYYKSLNKFLSGYGVNRDFTSRSSQSALHKSRRTFSASFDSECEHFIDAVCEKHNIKTLTAENLAAIKTKFRRDSRKRYLFLYLSDMTPLRSLFIGPVPGPNGLNTLVEKEPVIEKKFHWKPALMAAVASIFVTLPLLFWFAVGAGWIPLDKYSRYLIFKSDANLDGEEYSAGDYLKVLNEEEFAVRLEVGSTEKVYPTKAAASILQQRGNSPIEKFGIDKFGTADYELKQARRVFKVTKPARVSGRQFPVGSIIDVSVDDGRQWCLTFGKKVDCFLRRGPCRSDCIDDYGHVISNYRGKHLFTFNQAASIDSTLYQKGSSLEVGRDSSWATCLNTPAGTTARCFLKEAAINRFTRPNVPVVTDYGIIDQRKLMIESFHYWAAAILTLLVAGLVLWQTAHFVRRLKLFFLRGEINTLRFQRL